MSIINEWQPNLAPISGNAVTMLGAAAPPRNPKQTSSTLEEAVQSPGESGRAPVMGVLLFPITPRPKCPTTRLPRATPTAFWVRGEGARSGLCGKDEGKG